MMKKIIIGLIILTAVACEKTTPPQSNNVGGTQTKSVSITVYSNYLRSVLLVTNLTDNVNEIRWNYSGYNGDCPYTKTFTAQAGKTYAIYSYSTKNSNDSTFAMTDSKPVWNRMKVEWNGHIYYDKTDSIGTGSWRICSNNYTVQ